MRPTFTTPEAATAAAADVRIFAEVALVIVQVDPAEREIMIDVTFWGNYPDERTKNDVERTLLEAGYDLADFATTTLGLWQRWKPCIPVQWSNEVPEPVAPSAAELAHWSAILAEEAITDGRHHRPALINPHGD